MSFFGGMPFPVQFFLAFVIVLGLIGATAWAVRRFGSGRLGGVGVRGRQPRLAVIDYATVDGRRRLILVRRDNVEHLVMIGGPTDVVVESNIVRATAAPREISVARPPAAETLSRALPLPDGAANGSWTPHPDAEPAAPNAPRPPRGEPVPEEPAAFPLQPRADAQPRPRRDTLAALADELATQSIAPQRSRTQVNARPQPAEPRQEPRPPAAPVPAEPATAADQSLAEMAQRLEAALRKPNAQPNAKTDRIDAREPRPAATSAAHDAPVEAAAAAPPPLPSGPSPPPARVARAADTKPPRADARQPNPGKALYDSLEQEMASLLGRPPAKN